MHSHLIPIKSLNNIIMVMTLYNVMYIPVVAICQEYTETNLKNYAITMLCLVPGI